MTQAYLRKAQRCGGPILAVHKIGNRPLEIIERAARFQGRAEGIEYSPVYFGRKDDNYSFDSFDRAVIHGLAWLNGRTRNSRAAQELLTGGRDIF